MARRFVDISVPLKAGIASDPPPLRPQIDYMDHDGGAKEFEQMAGVPVDRQLESKGLRQRDVPNHDSFRHTSRCALALSSDNESRRAFGDDR